MADIKQNRKTRRLRKKGSLVITRAEFDNSTSELLEFCEPIMPFLKKKYIAVLFRFNFTNGETIHEQRRTIFLCKNGTWKDSRKKAMWTFSKNKNLNIFHNFIVNKNKIVISLSSFELPSGHSFCTTEEANELHTIINRTITRRIHEWESGLNN
jgi:hypothetical protein